jgi:AcrR family transcriptional regulator
MSTRETTEHLRAHTRPQRADARRNRERVLAGARACFAEYGLAAQMPDIARQAGVGVGTLYRHFPTKAALLSALAASHFERLVAIASRIEKADLDPSEAVFLLVREAAALTGGDVAMCEVLSAFPPPQVPDETMTELRAITARLLDRAKKAGAVRADATESDIGTMMCGFGRVAAVQRLRGSVDAERYLALMLDGLRGAA